MNTKDLIKIKKLADAGSAADQYTFARAHYWGSGVKENHDVACEYYFLSAKQGFTLALKGLQRMADENHLQALECQKSL